MTDPTTSQLEVEPTEAVLSEPVRSVTDALGELMAFWGFPRSHGRIWAVLYLADGPLSAAELGDLLQLSAGQVSTSLRELETWEAIHAHRASGERRTRYVPETNLFRMVTRVFRERELAQIRKLASALQRAKQELNAQRPAMGAAASLHAARLRRLEGLIAAAELGRSMVERLIAGTLLPKALVAAMDRPLDGQERINPAESRL